MKICLPPKISRTIICLLFALVSCDDTTRSSIPDYPVNLERNVFNEPNLQILMSPGNYKEFIPTIPPEKITDRLGFGGLLVLCNMDDYGNLQYFAFDLACPYEVERETRVTMLNSLQAECAKCGSKFNMGFGTGTCAVGPAKEGLRRYRVAVSGYNIRVFR